MKTDEIINAVVGIARDFHGIKRVIVFGSAARGDEGRGSDLDVAVEGEFDYYQLDERIKGEIDTLRTIDIVEYDEVKSRRFKEEIDRYGRVVYSKA